MAMELHIINYVTKKLEHFLFSFSFQRNRDEVFISLHLLGNGGHRCIGRHHFVPGMLCDYYTCTCQWSVIVTRYPSHRLNLI